MTVDEAAPPNPSAEPDSATRTVLSPTLLAIVGTVVVAIAELGVCVSVWSGQTALIPDAVRAVVVVAGAFLLPGLVVAAFLRLHGLALWLVVTVPVSAATTVIAAQTQIVLAWWHPVAATTVQATLSLVLAGVLARRRSGDLHRSVPITVGAQWARRAPVLVLLAIVLALFVVATRTVDVRSAGATGIVTHVGPAYLVALVLLAVAIVRVLTDRVLDPALCLVTIVVAMVVTAMLTALASGSASFPTAFIHRGIIEILDARGSLPPPSDARFSWAGYFSAGAQLVRSGGLGTAEDFLLWAPIVATTAMIAPLYVIGFCITRSRRLAWTGIAIYVLANWYQQDYFSPQSLATLFYACILALLLWMMSTSRVPTAVGERSVQSAARWVVSVPARSRARRAAWWAERPEPATVARDLRASIVAVPRRIPSRPLGRGAGWTLGLEGILVLLLAALVVTHQLTPIVTVGALVLFTLCGLIRFRLLWLVGLGLFTAWFAFGASDFWVGHLNEILGDVGQVQGAVDKGLAARLGADPSYQNMQYLRLVASGGLIVAGAVGWWHLRPMRGRLLIGALAAMPMGLIAVQSYGGEVIIRCLVLASPVLAPLAAIAAARGWRAVLRLAQRTVPPAGARTAAQAVGVLVVLVISLLLVADRGLNTSFEYTTREQDRLGAQFLQRAPTGTSIMAWGTGPTLVSPRLFTEVKVSDVSTLACVADLVACTTSRDPDYVYATDQSRALLRYQYGFGENTVSDQLERLVESRRYRPMVDADGVVILRRADAPRVEVR